MRPDLLWVVWDALGYTHGVEELGHSRGWRPPADPTMAGLMEAMTPYSETVIDTVIHAQMRGVFGKPESRPLSPKPPKPKPPAKRKEADAPFPDDAVRINMTDIPLFDASVAAGPFTDVSDIPGVPDPTLFQGIFMIRISGDSMTPTYKNGSVILFETAREFSSSLKGEDCYIQLDDGTASFKKIEDWTDDDLFLRAANRKKYPNRIVVSRPMVVKIAIAKGEFKPFDGRR